MKKCSEMTDDFCDERIIEISSRMYDLSMLLSGFMLEMLETAENYSLPVEAVVPVYDNEVYVLFRTGSVDFDRESGEIMVYNSENRKAVSWNSLDVVAMDTLVNAVHLKRKVDNCYRELKDGGASLN